MRSEPNQSADSLAAALSHADALERLAALESGTAGPAVELSEGNGAAVTPASLHEHFTALVAQQRAQALALKRQRLLYTTIVETMREITLKALDLNRFEQYTLNTVRGHFGVMKLWLWRQKDYGDTEIGVHTARLPDPPELTIALDGPFALYLREHPAVIDVLTPPDELLDTAELEALRALGAAIALPLAKKDETGDVSLMGMIAMGPRVGRLPYTPDDCEFLSLLGSMIGVTLYNAHLYQRSIIDNLTRVYSRGHFDIHLEQEIVRAARLNDEAARGQHPPTGVTLVMLDIDHFKQFNDRYGHQVGDQVLAEVAAVLKQSSRSMDVVCRYGGEEFGVISPDVTSDKAPMIAERMRKAVESKGVVTEAFGALKVTISLGVSVWPVDAPDARLMVARADQALYAAKRAGRNRVCIARDLPRETVA